MERSDKNMLKLITWIVMDGTVVDKNPLSFKNKRIQFKLSKERKIISLCDLLSELHIEYTIREATMSKSNKLQPYYICIYGDVAAELYNIVTKNKKFPEFFEKLDNENCLHVLRTIEETDGYRQYNNNFNWVNKHLDDIYTIQKMCNKNNIDCLIKSKVKSGFKKGSYSHLVKVYIEKER